MADTQIFNNPQELAAAAADSIVANIKNTLEQQDKFTWVLAGGTAPMLAYKVLSEKYASESFWKNVNFVLGDERIVPLYDPLSNWYAIHESFLSKLKIDETNMLAPNYYKSAEDAASDYEATLRSLPAENSVPKINELWLGMGEDGHTLSLFPGHDNETYAGALVTAVHYSPKPPPDRISLTLKSLASVKDCKILCSGESKSEIIAHIINGENSYPIAKVIEVIESNGGKVTWQLDSAAASLI